ncbi:VENN motif pre-toxin domain-containing protein [Pantoea ananatis]|uniref:VENN motif pre-toxin domain-containing protein n=1 Tax=Pantoea ananas TaxID=553 RepID=UPI0023B10CEA|nr:VENN motif pre-toxin domain-containing protein [Pantoea ananatis]
MADIARTQGEICALKEAQKVKGPAPESASEKVRNAYIESLKATTEYKKAIADSGTGSSLQQGIQAATAAVQGLAGGDFKAALAVGSAPYLAELINKNTTITGPDGKEMVNTAANLMAHAVVVAAIAKAQGNSALSGAGGAALGEFIAQEMYPGIARTDLSEEQKQTISALGTLAAGLAGRRQCVRSHSGRSGGENAVENNALSSKDEKQRQDAKWSLPYTKDADQKRRLKNWLLISMRKIKRSMSPWTMPVRDCRLRPVRACVKSWL